MRISKVLNSSVVLVQDDNGEESILLGKGIGYGRRPGQTIDRQPSDRVFIPLSNPDAQPMIELFSSIPPVYLELTQDIVADAEASLGVRLSPHIYLMLTDHLHFAVERQQLGITVTNRVLWELKHFYKREYDVGLRGLQRACQLLNVFLPEEEAGNIAFHIVNARMDVGAGGDAMQAARLIGELTNIVTYRMHTPLDTESIAFFTISAALPWITVLTAILSASAEALRLLAAALSIRLLCPCMVVTYPVSLASASVLSMKSCMPV